MPFEAEIVAVHRRSVDALYAYVARRAGGERDLAEDVTQETFLRAVEAWRRAGPPREPLAWLKTTARNLLLHHWRRAERGRVSAGEIDLDRLHAPATARAAALLHAALARLRARDAALLEAFHLDGRPVRELASELGVTEKAVEGRLRRARAALATVLAPWIDAPRPIAGEPR